MREFRDRKKGFLLNIKYTWKCYVLKKKKMKKVRIWNPKLLSWGLSLFFQF